MGMWLALLLLAALALARPAAASLPPSSSSSAPGSAAPAPAAFWRAPSRALALAAGRRATLRYAASDVYGGCAGWRLLAAPEGAALTSWANGSAEVAWAPAAA